MKIRLLLLFLLGGLCYQSGSAQTTKSPTKKLQKVGPTTIRDAKDQPVKVPYLGEKNILIFYIDPEKANQNKKFREGLEANHIDNPEIYSFGVINLKDAPLYPNVILRAAIRQKEKQNNVTIYTDPDHLLRDAWALGDVNDSFTLIFVNKNCEIEFLSKGEMSQANIDEFFRVINKYR